MDILKLAGDLHVEIDRKPITWRMMISEQQHMRIFGIFLVSYILKSISWGAAGEIFSL